MPRTQIRPARPEDANHIAGLLVDLYEAETPEMLTGPRDAHVELLRRLVAGNPAAVRDGLVLTDDDAPIGYGATGQRRAANPADVLRTARTVLGSRHAAVFTWGYFRFQALVCSPLPPGTVELHSLVIDPALRGRGHGGRLLSALEQRAQDNRHRIGLLYVVDGNRARRLYERMGYLVVPTPPISGIRFLLRQPGVAMAKTLSSRRPVPSSRTQDPW